jgi:uncharacterized membrane protein YbhN (UPF0104 family)
VSGAPVRPGLDHNRETAPAAASGLPVATEDDEHGLEITRRGLLTLGGFLLAALAALYFLLPKLAGLQDTWHRIKDGSPWWMALALLFTVGMFGGYVMQFRGIFLRAPGGRRIGWRSAYEITMAGLAASRLFAAGGAGGLVLTAWALRRSGMARRDVADTTVAFLILTYVPYGAAVIVCGVGLRLGVFPGAAPFTLTVLPALFAAVAMAIAMAIAFVPPDLQRRAEASLGGGGRLGQLIGRLANAPASASAGIRLAVAHVRSGNNALIGAILFWAFQILVLWAAFRAFGAAPPVAVLVQAFFVGMLGNLLPLPGGVGGVEGGMIGALAAFDVDSGLAVVAVLVFRAFTFWLPLIPGVVAYFQLRRTVDRWRATIQSEVKDPVKGANAVHGT